MFSSSRLPNRMLCTLDMVDDAINYNLNMASDTYETLLRQMPEKQRNVFIAISAEGEARSVKSEPSQRNIISRRQAL